MPGFDISFHARTALWDATDLARRLRSPVVCPEHLLLALAAPNADSFLDLVDDLGVRPTEVALIRERVERRLRSIPSTGDEFAPNLPSTRRVLQQAMSDASDLGHGTVERGHLLLAYLQLRDGPARDELVAAGLTIEAVRQWVAVRYSRVPHS